MVSFCFQLSRIRHLARRAFSGREQNMTSFGAFFVHSKLNSAPCGEYRLHSQFDWPMQAHVPSNYHDTRKNLVSTNLGAHTGTHLFTAQPQASMSRKSPRGQVAERSPTQLCRCTGTLAACLTHNNGDVHEQSSPDPRPVEF